MAFGRRKYEKYSMEFHDFALLRKAIVLRRIYTRHWVVREREDTLLYFSFIGKMELL